MLELNTMNVGNKTLKYSSELIVFVSNVIPFLCFLSLSQFFYPLGRGGWGQKQARVTGQAIEWWNRKASSEAYRRRHRCRYAVPPVQSSMRCANLLRGHYLPLPPPPATQTAFSKDTGCRGPFIDRSRHLHVPINNSYAYYPHLFVYPKRDSVFFWFAFLSFFIFCQRWVIGLPKGICIFVCILVERGLVFQRSFLLFFLSYVALPVHCLHT